MPKYINSGRSVWTENLRTITGEIFKGGGDEKAVNHTDGDEVENADKCDEVEIYDMKFEPNDLKYTCGKCGNDAAADRKRFNLRDLGLKSRCGHCKKLRCSRTWRCQCGDFWYLCPRHRGAAGHPRREEVA